jgi:tetratricopeptide (TPR) repeat protein
MGIDRAEPRLLERERQLALIRDWLAGARRGGGRLALVLAGAGLGKSTLLDRAAELARDTGVATLRARGSELGREMPFGIVRQLFETAVRRMAESEQSLVLAGAASHIRSLLGLADEPAAGGDLLGMVHARSRPMSVLCPSSGPEFIHPIARTAIYKEMAPGERSRAHRYAAGILSRDGASELRVAAHALVCEPSGDQEVVAWLRAAAETALLEGAPDGAARYLRRALTEPPAPENRPQLHFELGRALIGLDATEAAERFGDAAQGSDGSQRRDALREQAYALGYAGRLGDAMAAYDRAIDLAGPDTDAGLHLIGTRDFYGAWWGEAPDRDQRRLRIRELATSGQPGWHHYRPATGSCCRRGDGDPRRVDVGYSRDADRATSRGFRAQLAGSPRRRYPRVCCVRLGHLR